MLLCQPRMRDKKEFVETDKKRVMVRAGRRGGKTVGVAIRAAKKF